jgi:hypothetical protein
MSRRFATSGLPSSFHERLTRIPEPRLDMLLLLPMPVDFVFRVRDLEVLKVYLSYKSLID